MSDIPTTVRQQIRERSEGRCEFTSMREGRCAGTADDAHHLTLRARRGKHTTDNLAYICRPCHRKVHRQEKPFYDGPFTDKKDRTFYTYPSPDARSGEKYKLYLWHQIAEGLQGRAMELDEKFQRDYQRETLARIDMAETLAEMERFAMFPLVNGQPDDAIEYAQSLGITSPSTVRAFLASGKFLLDNKEDADKIRAYNGEAMAGREFTWSMLKGMTGSLNRLDAHDRQVAIEDAMNLRAAGHSGSEAVQIIRGDVPQRNNEWEVTAYVEMPRRRVTLRVSAPTTEGALKAFGRSVGASGPLGGALVISGENVREV